MILLAIVGSPRKGKATDTLVDKAIEGAKSKYTYWTVKKIHLNDVIENHTQDMSNKDHRGQFDHRMKE